MEKLRQNFWKSGRSNLKVTADPKKDFLNRNYLFGEPVKRLQLDLQDHFSNSLHIMVHKYGKFR